MLICENLFKDRSFEMHFFREQFWGAAVFWNILFEAVILFIFDLWLLISVVAADNFCIFDLYLTLLLSNYFYLFISSRKTLWAYLQDRWLLTYGTFKNAGSKPGRSRFYHGGTLLQGWAQTYKSDLLSITTYLV